ncbi:MAG: ATP-binding protein [SAR324 cluster bacterium]|nr:ATP-binding protein [SAR324 cluster bacterium]
MDNFIERRAKAKLKSLLQTFPAVAIVGPRQVGKTTLAQVIANESDKTSIYLDLDSPEDFIKLQEPELYLRREADKLVILDEIQQRPNLFPILRSLIDAHRQPGRFLLLGSASPELLKQSAESLAGRIIYMELAPLDYKETLDEEKLWFRGGFPLAFLAPSEESAREWLRAFLEAYLHRDLPNFGIRIPPLQLRQFWEMLAHLHGQLWNGSKLAANFGLSVPTMKRYLSILESTYLVRQLYPYSANVKKRLVKTPKVFVRDSGILHTLLRIPSIDHLFSHPILGASYEGWIIEQICANLPSEAIQPYFYRTHAGGEIDLLLDTGIQTIAIEIRRSLSPKPTRGFFEAIQDLHCEKGFVVYPGKESYPIHERVEAISLPDIITRINAPHFFDRP